MDNYCCEDLTKKLTAINAIRNQPYYGRDKQDYTIQYIYSHAMWYVGDYNGLMQVRGKCGKEVIELEKRINQTVTY